MSNAVSLPAPDMPPPTDLAVDTVTGQIGTVAELEAANKAAPVARAEVVKPGEVEAEPVKEPVKEPVALAPDKAAELQAAADRLRASGAARRARVSAEAELRGHAQTLEQRLAASERARQAAEALAARDPLERLKEAGQVGKVFQQAAIDENAPEALARRAIADAAAAREELAAFRREAAQAAQSQRAAAGRDQFIQYATTAKELGDDGKPSDVAAFPHVAAHIAVDRVSVEEAADRLIRIAHSRNRRPTWDQVLQELQTRYEKAAKLVGGPVVEAETVAEPPKTKPAKGANGAAALTKKTQERAVAGKRFEDMEARDTSRGGTDEQLEYIAELARQEARR
jgi:hypothetical protein